ncbi:MAG: cadherin repeat domain-containing protein, partial [Chromatiales bacterium]|nr:cadherin repeat domain-containing protein [Chromatiales bacterium]
GPVGNTEPNNDPQITSDGGGDTAAVSVAENSTAVTTVTATDPDADNATLTYSLSGGADQGRFIIDGATGALSFLVAPNFEAPADADGDNVYEIEVTVTDDHGGTDTQTISVSISDVTGGGDTTPANQAPVITSDGGGATATVDVLENSSAVTTVVATDQDGQTVSYTIVGGADADKFNIDSASGALSFNVAPNFEAPSDRDGNNIFEVIVQASDSQTPTAAFDTQTITVNVLDDPTVGDPVTTNQNPTINSSPVVSVEENTLLATTVTAIEPDGQDVSFSLTGGVDQAKFTIDADTGALSFLVAPNFEAPADADGDNVYEVEVTVSDGYGGTDIQAITITVTDVVGSGDTTPDNRLPVFSNTDTISVPENTTSVMTVAASDPDGQDVSYAIIGGSDAGLFNIDADTGALNFLVAPNFEAPADVGEDNVYELTVEVTDASGGTATQNITITVTDVIVGDPSTGNQAPVIGSGNSFNIDENLTDVGSVVASDPDGHGILYSISGGADAALFQIDNATGALSFLVAPDYENPTDLGDTAGNNTYVVEVTVSDNYSTPLTATQTITVTVNDTNVGAGPVGNTEPNNAPLITSDGGGDTAAVSVAENSTAVTTVTAADPDADNVTLTYSLSGGADQGRFTIDGATGALSFLVAPNFEAPADADGDNVYEIEVTVTDDHGGTDTQTISVSVSDVTGGGDTTPGNRLPLFSSGTTASVPENTTAVMTVAASDPDGQAVSYAIVGGADAASFQIDSATGALIFVAAPDFEAPTDVNGDNDYEVTVSATDTSGGSQSQSLVVTVTDVAVGAGPVGDTEPNNEPQITSDGGGDTAAVSVAENSTAVTTVTATDPDADNVTLTYSLSGGADQGRFIIDGATGALSFLVAPNFEAPADADGDNVYEIEVTVTDDHGGTDIQTISVTVTDVTVGDPNTGNQAPVINSGNSFNIDENLTDVGSVVASDPDGHGMVYSISGGADAALFRIDNTTGALSFLVAPDYENPTDLGDTAGNNTYVVEVTVSDNYSTPLTATQTITVTVNDVIVGAGPVGNLEPNNTPVITSDGGGDTATITVAEHTTAVTTVTATDPDTDNTALTYSIIGGVDAQRFVIDANTGLLSFLVGPDYEAPADANDDNSYQVRVSVADDNGGTDIQALTINVTDVVVGDPSTENDAPVFTSSATVSVQENNLTATTVTAADPDGHALSYSIVGGADVESFTIDPDTGVLNFHVAPNFEAPADSNLDGIYTLTVQVDDAHGGVTTQNLTITITNDLTGADPSTTNQAPIFTSAADRVVPENSTSVGAVTASDPDGQRITFSIAGGVDAGSFTIDPTTGALEFITTPNFEAPHDAEADNVYELMVTATDAGGASATQNMLITVSDVNEFVNQPPAATGEAPVFTSEAIRVVQENSVGLGAVTASDPDGDQITYTIAGGADAASFSIDPITGTLQFIAAPDFESPHDVDANNVYELIVSATNERGDQSSQSLLITVTNVDESTNQEPVITSVDSFLVPENT